MGKLGSRSFSSSEKWSTALQELKKTANFLSRFFFRNVNKTKNLFSDGTTMYP